MTAQRDKLGRLLPGSTANPNGRPKRKTFRDYFTEEEEEALINRIKQESQDSSILKMTVEQLFGKPRQPIDGGLDENDKPIPLLYVLDNNSNEESSKPQEEN